MGEEQSERGVRITQLRNETMDTYLKLLEIGHFIDGRQS